MKWETWIPIGISLLSLLVSARTHWRTEARERRREAGLKRERLDLSTERLNGEELLVRLTFQKLGDHTRYRARLTVLPPSPALLSQPDWNVAPSSGFVSMPTLVFDPHARQGRTHTTDLSDQGPYAPKGQVVGFAVARAPGGLEAVRLTIEIQDVATGTTVLSLKETLTA